MRFCPRRISSISQKVVRLRWMAICLLKNYETVLKCLVCFFPRYFKPILRLNISKYVTFAPIFEPHSCAASFFRKLAHHNIISVGLFSISHFKTHTSSSMSLFCCEPDASNQFCHQVCLETFTSAPS